MTADNDYWPWCVTDVAKEKTMDDEIESGFYIDGKYMSKKQYYAGIDGAKAAIQCIEDEFGEIYKESPVYGLKIFLGETK